VAGVEVTRFLLLRHGAPEADARGRCYGELDVALSAEGREQAACVKLPHHPDVAYSSPRKRALETARLVAPEVPLTVEPALREIDFGAFEGLRYEEAEARDPALYRAWMERPTEVTFPGGESWSLVRARVAALSRELRSRHAQKTILIVAHGGPLRALLAEALGLPDAHVFRIDQSFAGLSIIDWFGEVPLVRRVNA
jgi:alpha-ribazole phosphatase/probable phosphoglycerate mutase